MSNPYETPQSLEPAPRPPFQLPRLSPAWRRVVRIAALMMLGAAAFVAGVAAYFAIVWLFEPVPPS